MTSTDTRRPGARWRSVAVDHPTGDRPRPATASTSTDTAPPTPRTVAVGHSTPLTPNPTPATESHDRRSAIPMSETTTRPVTMIVAGRPYPPTLSTAQTAELWGCSPERLYAEMGRGTLPIEPLALGRRYRWPTIHVADALGLPVEVVHNGPGCRLMAERMRLRPNGSGSVRNRGTDRQPRWFAYYSVVVEGKRSQLSKGPFPRKSEADDWLRAEVQRARDGRPTLPSKTTVAELLDEWLAARRPALEPNTYAEYERIARQRIKPHLGARKVKDLRPSHVHRMLDALRAPGANLRGKRTRGLSETSLQHTYVALRSALDYAIRQRIVSHNVMEDVERPKREATDMRVWSAEQLATFLDIVAGDRLHALFRLASPLGCTAERTARPPLDARRPRRRHDLDRRPADPSRLPDGPARWHQDRRRRPGSRPRPRHDRCSAPLAGGAAYGTISVGSGLCRLRSRVHRRER